MAYYNEQTTYKGTRIPEGVCFKTLLGNQTNLYQFNLHTLTMRTLNSYAISLKALEKLTLEVLNF